MRRAKRIVLTDADRKALRRVMCVTNRGNPYVFNGNRRRKLRAQIIWMAADGYGNKSIALHLDTTAETASRWRRRFALQGVASIEHDAPRAGRPPLSPDVAAAIKADARDNPHTSLRELAAKHSVGRTTVQKVLRSEGIAFNPSRTGFTRQTGL